MIAVDVTMDSYLIDCCATFITVGRRDGGSFTVKSGSVLVDTLRVANGSGAQGSLTLNAGQVAVRSLLSFGDTTNSTGTATISGGQLTVTSGFTVVGNLGSGQMTISGGTVSFLSELHVADNPGATGAVSVVGGQLAVTNDITAIGRYGLGQMTISNATALLTNVSVGRHEGANGTLTLQTNGMLFTLDDLSIGRFTNAVGNLLVNGGQLSLTNQNLWVGREGIGQMTVSNGSVRAANAFVGMSPDGSNAPKGTLTLAGGTTVLSSNMVVGTPSVSTGQVFVVGGNLIATSSSGSSFLSIARGSFTLDGGTVSTDKLLLTNSAGQFTFNGGTLLAKSMTVSNGLPFVLGDGVHPATLQMQGGTFYFGAGLLVNTNATLTGCGSIIGPITSYGTIATNCLPFIQSLTKTGATATVSFTTLSGSNHVLEYKNALNGTGWTAILPGVTGNGSVVIRTDTNATTPSRFYRIHLQ